MFLSRSDPMCQGAVQVVRRLKDAGFTALWAGGCVRDLILAREPKDYDVATNATPDQVEALFRRSMTVGKSFGVVRVPVDELWYEVATFRKDHDYKDGRRPESVSFTDARTDAERRDFTVNALFYDPIENTVLDYVDGQTDLQNRLIRAVGCADQRFNEDHLRMLRAVRFACTLDFTLDLATADAIRAHAVDLARISAERIQQELTRILLESVRPGDALQCLFDVGLLQVILPDVVAMRGQEQPPQFHPEGDVFTHTKMMLNAMRDRSVQLAYSVLLHDVGKPVTAKMVGDRIRFDQHASRGAEMADEILRRLKFSNDDIKSITTCIANHMRFMDVPRMKRSTLHRMVMAPTFPVELDLHFLDCEASHGDTKNVDTLRTFHQDLMAQPARITPWITGHDVMSLGVPEGRQIGHWLKRAYEAQLEEHVRDREDALSWLRAQIAAEAAEGKD